MLVISLLYVLTSSPRKRSGIQTNLPSPHTQVKTPHRNLLIWQLILDGSRDSMWIQTSRKNKFTELYTTWISNSCNGSFADKVAVAVNEQSKPMGFITVKTQKNKATIGLLGVSNEHRKRGVATALIQHAKSFAFKHGCGRLDVGTQAKTQVQISCTKKKVSSLNDQKAGSTFGFREQLVKKLPPAQEEATLSRA